MLILSNGCHACAANAVEAHVEPVEAQSYGPPQTRSVLLIEPDLANCALIEAALRRWPDVSVFAAMQGRMGLELARHHRPVAVLLDLGLENPTGLEVLHALKADERTREIPVVTFSSRHKAALAGYVEELGVLAHLTTPLDMRRFVDLFGRLLAAP